MKIFFHQNFTTSASIEEELAPLNLKDSIQKTHRALEIAYVGFDNAIEAELIDSYIYEIIALQKRHKYLSDLAASEPALEKEALSQHSPIRALVSHVFG